MSIFEEVIASVTPATRAVEVAGHRFTFQTIGAGPWSRLAVKHPPTDEQRQAFADLGRLLEHNPDTFVTAAMAASCVEIDDQRAEATTERFQRLATKLDLADWQQLWQACLDANVGGADVPPPEKIRPSGTQDQPDADEIPGPGGASAAA